MSVTAAVWALAATLLTGMTLSRAIWAVALYMLTFFAAPQLWWWGGDLPALRYALLAGLTLIVGVVLHASAEPGDAGRRFTYVHLAALLMAVNATAVHFFFATSRSVSIGNYVEVLKYVLLVFLLWKAIQDKRDLRITLIAIALGAAYIGYEITFNERGNFSGGRLEGVGAPGADTANGLACLMLITLPLTGSLFIHSNAREKLLVALSAPLALNVLLLCNSRGAFLGLIGAALSFVLAARGPTRKRAVQTLALGAVALYLMLGDARIMERFTTTFAGSEDRDESAASRLEFWQAGMRMLDDYPLGAGGGAFKYTHGSRYLSEIAGMEADRSLHNGYLTEATSWGIQGLALQLLMFAGAILATYRTSNRCRLGGRVDEALIGICFVVAALGFLIHCMFGSFLGNEWGFWLVALMVRYSELYDQVDSPAPPPDALAA